MADRALMWFRRDLRLEDNPAWAAASSSREVAAVFVADPRLMATAGDIRRDQLLAHLAALDGALAARGGRLRVEVGDAAAVIPAVAAELRAGAVHANADVTPFSRRRDGRVASALGCPLVTHWGTLVHHPAAVTGSNGRVPLVFTPFHRRWSATPWHEWAAEPRDSAAVLDDPGSGAPAASGPPAQVAGQDGAHARLSSFLERVDDYGTRRDDLADLGTSRLSADLRFGTISPRRVVAAVGDASPGRQEFVRQLAWRDWYAHLLWAEPRLVGEALKPAGDRIAWRDDPDGLAAWQDGRTGYPLVDAGMRELAATGFLHNRVRMVCASFLSKHLLVDWRQGEAWFRRLLLDGDVPQNVGNWQWVAGTGPDPVPYFRVFNPTEQRRRFDPDGAYVRRWVPELDSEPTAYPPPIVDHGEARARAIATHELARRP